MKNIILSLVALLVGQMGISQNTDKSFVSEDVVYHYEDLNRVDQAKALLVLFDGGAGKAARIAPETSLPDSAIDYRFKTIGIDQSELFISDSCYSRIRTIIAHVMKEEGITENLFIGGFSLGGYTALRFSELAVQKKDKSMIPNAVFAIDPPIDHLDFVNYCQRELTRDCPNKDAIEIGRAEAAWILDYYNKNFGPLESDSAAYIANSCFTASLPDGGNAKYLIEIPLNMIHEIDIMWLIRERCRDLADANALISSKLINYLYKMGNLEATLTQTSNKGYRADGIRHPHSWSIADPTQTLDWLSRYTNYSE